MHHSEPSVLRRFFGYLEEFKFAFFISLIGMAGYAAVDTWVIRSVQPVIDKSMVEGDFEYLRLAAYFVVPVFLVRGVFNFLGSYVLAWIGNQVVMKMRQQLFEHFMFLPVAYHDNHSTGKLISKVIFDTEQVNAASSKALLTLVRDGAFVIFLLVNMFTLSWRLSLVFLIIAPAVALIVTFVSKRFRTVSRSIQKSMGNLTTSVEQMLQGHKVVLMFGGQKLENSRFKRRNNHNRQQNMKLIVARILSVSTIQVIASFALAVALYMASTPSLMESLTAGTFTSIVMSMAMLLKPLKQLTTVNSEFQRGMSACQSIFKVLDQPLEKDQGTQNLIRANGELQFSDVTFTYPDKETPALNKVNFKVNQGQVTALVGRSGSGKSTISSILTRFYNPDEGQVLLDGVDIKHLRLSELRQQFAWVSQQVTLFNDSIANNIAYGCADIVSREQIEQAAKAAHVLEFANGFPEGLDTEIGENGSGLSGGQRQRIAIARAILRDAPILILDEATSALDTESEKLIQEALEDLQKTRTSIVVAHRLSTIENADQILVVEQGEIVEQGDHQTLIGKDGIYAQLHKMQFSQG
jgi:subfamily B ATP-binding cassette protein MsbA